MIVGIEINTTDPTEWAIQLNELEAFIKRSREELNRNYRFCLGCKSYKGVSDLREDNYKGTVVLRCHDCNAIVKICD